VCLTAIPSLPQGAVILGNAKIVGSSAVPGGGGGANSLKQTPCGTSAPALGLTSNTGTPGSAITTGSLLVAVVGYVGTTTANGSWIVAVTNLYNSAQLFREFTTSELLRQGVMQLRAVLAAPTISLT
jgi:hypothetical protein